MNVIIESIHNEYSDAIVDIILPIQQKEFKVNITLNDQLDLLNIDEYYHKDGGGFWGAKVNGELVGTIALIKFSEDKGAIRKMFVKNEFRGKEFGIAGKLLQTLIDYSKEKGLRHLYLGTVNILAAAIRFYEKNHFEQIQKDQLPKDFPLMNADNIFCHLTLNQSL